VTEWKGEMPARVPIKVIADVKGIKFHADAVFDYKKEGENLCDSFLVIIG
jgi:hypothetical protein